MRLGYLKPPPLGNPPWRISALALDVAGRCNLACRYCAEAATQPRRRTMTLETMRAAYRLLCPDGGPQPGTSIRLGSGEPLLRLDLLKGLANLIESTGGSVSEGRPAVFLTTNGTLAGRHVRDWLVRSGWNVKVSLDGPPAVHDRWRVMPSGAGTFARVSDAVRDFAARIPERFSVTAVLCRGSDPNEVFDAIAEMGVRRIELVPAAHHAPAVLPDAADLEAYSRFLRRYARRLRDDESGGTPVLVKFENCVRRAMGYDLHRVPCGAGRTFLAVSPGGELYPCFRFVGIRSYKLGTLSHPVGARAGHAFESGAGRPYHLRSACARCDAAPLCGGPCFAVAEMFGPGAGEPLEAHCAYTRADARWALWLVKQLRAASPERLLRFLPGRPALG